MPSPVIPANKAKVYLSIKNLLQGLGYDLTDPDLCETPERVCRMLLREVNPPEVRFKTFPKRKTGMIALIGHTCYSRCPHHLEKVTLTVSIGYIPAKTITGFSKLPAIADFCASGLKLQEEFTLEVLQMLEAKLKPRGIGVYVTGQHMCMCSRGVESNGMMLTTNWSGLFETDLKVREEFLRLIK